MKSITPKNKQSMNKGAGPKGAGEMPPKGPGVAAMKYVRGMDTRMSGHKSGKLC